MDINFITRRSQWSCRRFSGSRSAVSFEDRQTWTHDQLYSRINAYANALLSLDVSKGDRVGLLMHNGLEYWAIYLAAARIGAIAVRLNFRLTAEELDFIIKDSASTVLCFHSSFSQTLDGIRSKLPIRAYIALKNGDQQVPEWAHSWSLLDDADSSPPPCARPDPADSSMLMYTSGTTGKPKGALWSHSNTLWFTAMQALQWGLNENTVAMTTGPMYHVGAVEDLASATLAMGGHAVVLKSGGFSLRRVLEVIAYHRVTDIFLFPFMVSELAQMDEEEVARYDISSVKRIISGGDPLLPWATQVLQQRHPWIELNQVYGLTEGTPISACSTGEETLHHPDSVGRPMPFTEISLRTDNGEEVGTDQDGEIWVRSPVVCTSYWRRPEESEATFVDGWCRTGDLGRLAGDGLLCMSGRKKDMIRSGGENVYPAEVEDILMRQPGIREVAVIGVRDAVLMETVCAVVVPMDGASLEASSIISACRKHLAGYKCPKHVVFTDQLPRTPSGKLMKYKLRDQHSNLGNDSRDASRD